MACKDIFNDLSLVVRLNQHIQQVTADPGSVHSSPRNAPPLPLSSPSLPRQSSFKVLADLEAVSTADPRPDARFEHQREGFALSASLPFHLQGDAELNAGSALARRRALRFSEPLRAKIVFLWDVARGDKEASAVTSAAMSAATSVEIHADDYMALMLLIFKVLRDDFSLELARRQILCDWDVDSRHGQALGFEQFFSAMFELVDVWTCDVEEPTYVRFLELLLRRVTVRVVVFLDGHELKLALSDNFDEAVVVKAIPLRTISRFASVARIVAPRGVRTIGELASADPAMVEHERVAYLQRASVSGDKIGRELTELLAMFRQLAHTFDHAEYSLHDGMVLKRRPSAAGDAFSRQEGGSEDARAMTRGGDRGLISADADRDARSLSVDLDGRPRLNSIHDISVADADLVTALKTSFVIDKRISLEKQTEISAVLAELDKFGVEDAHGLDEEAARRQYAALYELCVVRDGDDLKALAQAVLQQIKAELAVHGVAVDDDADAEAAYDHFYGAVVAGTGQAIVADAKQWVQHAVAAGDVGGYVKRDYHALRPVDEVAMLGSQPGDDEFLALVATDDADAEGDGNDGVAADSTARRQSSSPIQRKPSQLALGANAFRRALPEEPPPLSPTPSAADRRALKPTRPSGRRVGDREEGDGDGEDAHGVEKERKGGRNKRGKRKKKPSGESRHASERSDDELEAVEVIPASDHGDNCGAPPGDAQGASCREACRDDHAGEDGSGAATELSVDVTDSCHVADESSEANNEVDRGSDDQDQERRPSAVVAQAIGVVLDEDEEDLSRRRSEIASRPSRAGPLEPDDSLGDADGNHTSADGRDREPQGVDFAFEEAVPEPTPNEPKPELIRPADLPPKVPEIVIGGVASGTSTAVAGRYVQLLGLGSVTTTADEAALFALLESDVGRDTDLVCFDVGSELETARDKLLAIQRLVGRRVVLFGGVTSPGESPARLQAVVADCLAAGALYFATLPIDFPQLREQIAGFFEASARPYVLRSRKPAGRAVAAFQSATRTIGAAGIFSIQEAEPSRKLSTASAAVAHSGKGGLRKLTVSIPGLLPAIATGSSSPRLSLSLKAAAAEEIRAPELTPSAPLTPRSLKSYKKSPRLSAALNKLIR